MSASVLSLNFTKSLTLHITNGTVACVSMSVPDVPHHDVDKSIFYQAEEHKEGAGGHEHVNRLEIEIN